MGLSAAEKYEAYVASCGGTRVIRRILVANNGMAAAKFILSIRNWLFEMFEVELGDGHSTTLRYRNLVADCLDKLGKAHQACRLYEFNVYCSRALKFGNGGGGDGGGGDGGETETETVAEFGSVTLSQLQLMLDSGPYASLGGPYAMVAMHALGRHARLLRAMGDHEMVKTLMDWFFLLLFNSQKGDFSLFFELLFVFAGHRRHRLFIPPAFANSQIFPLPTTE